MLSGSPRPSDSATLFTDLEALSDDDDLSSLGSISHDDSESLIVVPKEWGRPDQSERDIVDAPKIPILDHLLQSTAMQPSMTSPSAAAAAVPLSAATSLSSLSSFDGRPDADTGTATDRSVQTSNKSSCRTSNVELTAEVLSVESQIDAALASVGSNTPAHASVKSEKQDATGGTPRGEFSSHPDSSSRKRSTHDTIQKTAGQLGFSETLSQRQGSHRIVATESLHGGPRTAATASISVVATQGTPGLSQKPAAAAQPPALSPKRAAGAVLPALSPGPATATLLPPDTVGSASPERSSCHDSSDNPNVTGIWLSDTSSADATLASLAVDHGSTTIELSQPDAREAITDTAAHAGSVPVAAVTSAAAAVDGCARAVQDIDPQASGELPEAKQSLLPSARSTTPEIIPRLSTSPHPSLPAHDSHIRAIAMQDTEASQHSLSILAPVLTAQSTYAATRAPTVETAAAPAVAPTAILAAVGEAAAVQAAVVQEPAIQAASIQATAVQAAAVQAASVVSAAASDSAASVARSLDSGAKLSVPQTSPTNRSGEPEPAAAAAAAAAAANVAPAAAEQIAGTALAALSTLGPASEAAGGSEALSLLADITSQLSTTDGTSQVRASGLDSSAAVLHAAVPAALGGESGAASSPSEAEAKLMFVDKGHMTEALLDTELPLQPSATEVDGPGTMPGKSAAVSHVDARASGDQSVWSSAELPHEIALRNAAALEQRLIDGPDGPKPLDATERQKLLQGRLAAGRAEWHQEGGIIGGAAVGSRLLLTLSVPPSDSLTVDDQPVQGEPTAFAVQMNFSAVGSSEGTIGVRMPSAAPATDGTSARSFRTVQLGSAASGSGAVTSLSFHSGGSLLIAGHVSGDVVLWEWHRTTWEAIKIFKDAHVVAISAVLFLEGTAPSALTADVRGRLLFHNLFSHLSLMGRLTKAAQPLVIMDGSTLGPISVLCAATYLNQSGGTQESSLGGDTLVAVGGPQAVYFCVCSSDGRLTVLHNLSRPPEAAPGTLPHVSFYLDTSASGVGGGAAVVMLAMTWQCSVLVLSIPVSTAASFQARPGSSGVAAVDDKLRAVMGIRTRGAGNDATAAVSSSSSGNPSPALPPPPQPARLVRRWTATDDVAACVWLSPRCLIVISPSGDGTSLAMTSEQGDTLEAVRWEDPLVSLPLTFGAPSAEKAPKQQSAHYAATPSHGGRLWLLCRSGQRLLRRLTNTERQAALCSVPAWRLAMSTALEWHAHTGAAGAESAAAASAAEEALLGHLDEVLTAASLAVSAPAKTVIQLKEASELAVEICILLGRPWVLWDKVFPQFQAYAAAELLLDTLLPCILSSQLPTPSPEVVQALLEHCAEAGRLEQVEQCVLHMSIASLDLAQVMKLCRRHQLTSAIVYVITRGLSDHVAPVVELLMTLADADAAEDLGSPKLAVLDDMPVTKAVGYKLLVYLQCCFRHQQFPSGSGELPAEQGGLVKAAVLGLLLFGEVEAMSSLWRSIGGCPSCAPSQLQQQLPGPHPALRRVMAVDAPAALAILTEVLSDWDALECDLAEASAAAIGSSLTAGSNGGRSATQAVVNAISDLLQSGAFNNASDSAPKEVLQGGENPNYQGSQVPSLVRIGGTLQAVTSAPYSGSAVMWALDFLAAFLGSGRATAAPPTTMRVLQYIAKGPWVPGQPAQDQNLREQRFISVLRHASSHTPHGQSARLGDVDMARAHQLAASADFLRAEAETLHRDGSYVEAIKCLLRSHRGAEGAVKYIEDNFTGSAPGMQSPRRAGAFRTAVLAAIPDLTAADAQATASLVLRCMPTEHASVVHLLAADSEAQFRYLKGALQASDETEAAALDDARKTTPSDRLRALHHGGAVAAHGVLLAREEECELYLRLLCEFEPSAVLGFLQSHTAYRVPVSLEWCRAAGVDDGEAYLLEHFLGDHAAALQIYLNRVDRCNQALVDAVKAGAAVLPGGAEVTSLCGAADVEEGALFHGPPSQQPSATGRPLVHVGSGMTAVKEAGAAAAARQAALDLCWRCSGDTVVHLPAEDLWFPLLQCYTRQLQALRSEELGDGSGSHHHVADAVLKAQPFSVAQLSSSMERLATGGPIHRHTDSHRGTAGVEETKRQLQGVQTLFTAAMEIVISQMAGFIPLQRIGEKLLAEADVQLWGECRGTLLGLLAAFNYEAGILTTAARLLNGDAIRDLTVAYMKRTHAQRLKAETPIASAVTSSDQPSLASSSLPVEPVLDAALVAGDSTGLMLSYHGGAPRLLGHGATALDPVSRLVSEHTTGNGSKSGAHMASKLALLERIAPTTVMYNRIHS